MIKLETKMAVYTACNNGSSSIITKDGELYMFGKDAVYSDSTCEWPCSQNPRRLGRPGQRLAPAVVFRDSRSPCSVDLTRSLQGGFLFYLWMRLLFGDQTFV